jgi:hypothetical protein
MKLFLQKLSMIIIILSLGSVYAQALTGDYYIPQGANPKGYATLAAACDSLTLRGASGVVNFIIDGNLTETAPCTINNATFTATDRVVIKPAPTKQPIVTFTGIDASNQFFLIVNSNYVTIDGSNGNNTDGTRDMTFAFNNATGRWCLEIMDNSDFFTVKNLFIKNVSTATASQTVGISVDGSIAIVGNAPNDIMVDNCQVGEATKTFYEGVAYWGNDPTSPVTGTIQNSDIYAGRRAITTFFIEKNKYLNNNIYIADPKVDRAFYAGIYLTGSVVNDTTVISGNKFIKCDVNTTVAKFAGAVVVYGNTGVINMFNNFVAPNFNNLGAATTNRYYGVVFGSPTWNGIINIANNTFRIDAPNTTAMNACIGYEVNSDAIMTIDNNIFHQGNSTGSSYILHYPMATSATNILTGNHNNYYLAGIGSNFGFFNTANVATLNDWKTVASMDAASTYKMVNFVSATDLHLTGSSNGDLTLMAVPFSWIRTDIDGALRSATMPYKGADEASNPLPVELSSFNANQVNGEVVLDWTTASETNNLGFEVERSIDGQLFSKIGFVRGAGSTTGQQVYKYSDNSALQGTSYYRLRQIDINGQFAYSYVVEVNFAIVDRFVIEQNYPNPFNPATTIKFTIPTAAKVSIKVYDMMGSEVADLLNKDLAAGAHQADFNASNFASGSYIYTITATSVDGKMYKESRKMQLLK